MTNEYRIAMLQAFINSPYKTDKFFCNFLDPGDHQDRLKLLKEYKLIEALELNRGTFIIRGFSDDTPGAFHHMPDTYTGKLGVVNGGIILENDVDFGLEKNPDVLYLNWKKDIARTAIKLLENIKD